MQGVRGSSASAARDVFGLVLPLEASVRGVEASLAAAELGPAGRLGHVVRGGEGSGAATLLVGLDQLLEAVVVDPRPPLPVNFELRGERTGGRER